MARSAGSTAILKPLAEWRTCLVGKGHTVTDETPLTVAKIVGAKVTAAAGGDGHTDEAYSGKVLPDPVAADFQRYELTLSADDDACQDSSGLGPAMAVVEQSILTQAKEKFPNFAGVNYVSK